MKYFFGIDSSSQTHSVQIVGPDSREVKHFEIENSVAGFEKLEAELIQFPYTLIGTELSHGPLVDFLQQKERKVYSLNPLKVKRFKEINIVSGDKSDRTDALAIAHFLRANERQLKPIFLSSPDVEELKVLCISHDRLIQERARYTNRLLFVIRQYFPLYDGLFSTTAPKILLHMILAFPCWKDLSSKTDAEIIEFLRGRNYRRPVYIERIMSRIRAYGHCVAVPTERALYMEATAISRVLLCLHDAIDEIEEKMQAITANHVSGIALQTIPGVGNVIASKILGVIGDNPARFTRPEEIQCLMGTAPANYQSGSYHKVIMRRACNKRGRNIFFQLAFSSLQYCPWARAYYDTQRKKGKRHSVAVRALSNKWARVVFYIWKRGVQYSENERKFQVA